MNPLRTIIAGSREIIYYYEVLKAINNSGIVISTVISGTARGIDLLGERYGYENNIPILRFPADWGRYKKQAGFIRNAEMAANADALIAIWDGISHGTANMIKLAKDRSLIVHIHIVDLHHYELCRSLII
jgi:hypothetical protein